VGTGERVRIGLDAWSGSGNVHILPWGGQLLDIESNWWWKEYYAFWSKMQIFTRSSDTKTMATRLDYFHKLPLRSTCENTW